MRACTGFSVGSLIRSRYTTHGECPPPPSSLSNSCTLLSPFLQGPVGPAVAQYRKVLTQAQETPRTLHFEQHPRDSDVSGPWPHRVLPNSTPSGCCLLSPLLLIKLLHTVAYKCCFLICHSLLKYITFLKNTKSSTCSFF